MNAQLVIGGGFAGLCSAYYLAKAGRRVVVVDRDPSMRESCSNRNAGMIVPSHFIPLAAPGVVAQGMKWMLNKSSPFSFRPQLDVALWKWCWQFWRHANKRNVENSRGLLRDLSLESRSLFEELSDELGFALAKRGLLMLCQSEEGLHEESEVAAMAGELGIQAEVCGPERLRELDPGVEMNALGGVWFSQDCHLDTEGFLAALRAGVAKLGGEFREGEITDFRVQGDRVTHAVDAAGEELPVAGVTVAGGAWSPEIARKLGLVLPMQGGKGYSFTLPNPAQQPALCSLLKEGRVAVTPMGDSLRVAGTMEIGGNDLSVNRARLQGVIDTFCRFFPAFEPSAFEGLDVWSGLRPCSPDGMPFVGRAAGFTNATVATGHSMLGLSLGPVTGRMIADLVAGGEVDKRLDPARFGRSRAGA
ncbi:MAG: NAD(P)/FAD-dependent oxidoreductase [Verrucomicrobiales bacterium]|nr:FAD-dependent oxidoreductase [Verrucomicrobiota bacterium JB025]